MQFLTSFVMVALIVQVVALVMLFVFLGSQALRRAVIDLWTRTFGSRKPGNGHSH